MHIYHEKKSYKQVVVVFPWAALIRLGYLVRDHLPAFSHPVINLLSLSSFVSFRWFFLLLAPLCPQIDLRPQVRSKPLCETNHPFSVFLSVRAPEDFPTHNPKCHMDINWVPCTVINLSWWRIVNDNLFFVAIIYNF